MHRNWKATSRRFVCLIALGGCSPPASPDPAAVTSLPANASGIEARDDPTASAADQATQSSLSAPENLSAPEKASRVEPGSQDPANPPTVPPPLEAARTLSDARIADKSFDDIKFDMEVGDPFTRDLITPEIEAIHETRIRIRGYILPTATKRGITDFVLVRDNQECCFGPGAALYDCILVEMEPGKTAEFSIRPVAVTGRFRIEPFAPFGDTLAIYHLLAESVE